MIGLFLHMGCSEDPGTNNNHNMDNIIEDANMSGSEARIERDMNIPDSDAGGDGEAGHDTSAQCNAVILSEKEESYLLPVFPNADRKIVHIIPEEMLADEYDRQLNFYLLELVDENCTTIGFAREITTEVGCVAGVCNPIHYYECLDENGIHKDIYSVYEDPLYFRKYWVAHIPFDEADMALTRSLVKDPPQAYIDVTDATELVVDFTDTAATTPEFIDITVRGGVFTIYILILYRFDTEMIAGTYL